MIYEKENVNNIENVDLYTLKVWREDPVGEGNHRVKVFEQYLLEVLNKYPNR
jgi:hypothetical protein